jgi:hypothetical protein
MSGLAGIGDLLKQYSAGNGTPANGPVVEQHPVLIKTLGAAALTIAMKKIADSHAA